MLPDRRWAPFPLNWLVLGLPRSTRWQMGPLCKSTLSAPSAGGGSMRQAPHPRPTVCPPIAMSPHPWSDSRPVRWASSLTTCTCRPLIISGTKMVAAYRPNILTRCFAGRRILVAAGATVQEDVQRGGPVDQDLHPKGECFGRFIAPRERLQHLSLPLAPLNCPNASAVCTPPSLCFPTAVFVLLFSVRSSRGSP